MAREPQSRTTTAPPAPDRAPAQTAAAGAALEPNPEARQHSTLALSALPPEPAADGTRADRLPLAPGDSVKHYEIVRELGRGGMGVVFLAQDTRLARRCAIKLLLRHTGAGAGQFLAEARTTARCTHESIVIVYEVDEIRGYPYMVLEHLEGRTLRAWMTERERRERREPAPPHLAVELVLPVVRALVCAHEMGIVHRDLKPENIFLTDAGQVKVLDFGIAKRLAPDEDPGATLPGALAGTPSYMSPEQWLGGEIGPQTDLWALGVILHELVTGSHPLAPATLHQLREVQDLQRPMPSVRERRPDVGPLGDVIDRCLEKQPAERIASARALLAALERVIVAPAPAAVPAAAAPATAAAGHPGRRRRTAAWTTAGIAAAVAATVAAVRVADRPGRPGAARRGPAAGTAITGVPLPPSQHPQARLAYAAALHGFRDANWATAGEQLRRAVALDPTLAAAHLRLAILLHYTAGRTAEARQSYANAVQWRAALSVRDRDILATFEPLFAREPPELVRFTTELAALARRYPDDAEIFALLAYFSIDGPEVQLRAARRAVEIDPEYADAWQAIGKQLFVLDRSDEALRAFDACLAVSPAAIDCLGERAQVHAALGQCARAEADLRDAVAASPQTRYWRDLHASSLMALGKPVEAAIEVLTQKWAAQPPARRELIELHDRARLHLLRGDFAAARASALALQARTRQLSDADLHARYATLLIDLASEAGQPADAAQAADDYLRRRDAWIGSGNIVDDIAMLTVLRDAGRLSADDFDQRREAWVASHRDLTGMRNEVWLAAWARPATTAAAARAALAAAPPGDLKAVVHSFENHAVVGTLLLRAGRAAEAIPFLERAARGCDGFLAPAVHVRAAAQLGRALEATGDRAGACAAYQRVLDRWGAATSRSVTARDAQLRARALGCAGGPTPPTTHGAERPP